MVEDKEIEKTVEDSYIEMREMVLPNDTNLLENLLGGRLVHFIDIAGAMVAQRHSNMIVATVSIDNVNFSHPIRLGEIVILKACLARVGNTSMDVVVNVFAENTKNGEILQTNKAYLTYVGLDDNQRPTRVPRLKITTDKEKKVYNEALKKRNEKKKDGK
jgi:acyl-CoA hydrolase